MNTHFFKPSDEVTTMYEDMKNKFLNKLYNLMEKKAEERAKKEGKKYSVVRMNFKTELTPLQAEIYREVVLKKRTKTEFAKEKGCSESNIRGQIKLIQNKLNLLGKIVPPHNEKGKATL